MVGNPVSPFEVAVMVRGCCNFVIAVVFASPEANQRDCEGKMNGGRDGYCDVSSCSEFGFTGLNPVALAFLLRLTRHESVEGFFVRFLL